MIAKSISHGQPAASSTTTFATPACPLTGALRTLMALRLPAGLLLALMLWGLPCQTTVKAQDQRKNKVPVIDKISSGGTTRQQFSGVVKSIDLESEILNVDTVNGSATEIFPVKKKVHVVTADGDKLNLTKLRPGTNVLVYFEQKGDHRTVTEIVVLSGGAVKKKAPAS